VTSGASVRFRLDGIDHLALALRDVEQSAALVL
jgi:hypothetical protein